ncbi:hypothetical protein TL16_g07674 [Triparma laevis f. inornata]|uniref:C-CAP/cofactor C-like domain-containing protein n=2 Tax=Triparma laevis TaxID=1534972 RepID=A0A9W7CBH8_9STRA|nr:hypothetical protein TL16_g07674 [Triparma laevis f. inornata]GMI03156.1 hypothetical protein TrLO_g2508 [Triparma laevis f. longispina]
MSTFTASDGTIFADRDSWRSYEFELMYTFKNLTGPTSPPPKTSLQGQPFDIADCDGVTLLVLDNTDQVQIDNCSNCRIFIAASSESVFIRDCNNCTVTLACKQLRTRDCKNVNFYLYSKTEPIIETSTCMKFAPFNGAYPGHKEAMGRAGLIPEWNLWFGIYDFNDEGRTGKNWEIMKMEEEEPIWCPLTACKNCCPRVNPGSIALPSQSGDGMGGGVTTRLPTVEAPAAAPAAKPASSGGMMSFTFDTNLSDAARLTGDEFVAQETTKKLAIKDPNAAPTPPAKKKSGVGWNPGAFAEPEVTLAVEEKKKLPQKKSSVGWNPGAFAEPNPAPVPAPVPVQVAAAPAPAPAPALAPAQAPAVMPAASPAVPPTTK